MLKHSYYTHVGLSFFRLFDSNFIFFVARPLIWCLVWMQVHGAKRAAVGSNFWSNGDQSKEATVTSRRPNVATSRRHDVGLTMQNSTSGNVATSARDLHPII